jgi:hypothetical protein
VKSFFTPKKYDEYEVFLADDFLYDIILPSIEDRHRAE